MSEYRVKECAGVAGSAWQVVGPVPCYCHNKSDAERIARALSALDAMEQDEGKFLDFVKAALSQARGEG